MADAGEEHYQRDSEVRYLLICFFFLSLAGTSDAAGNIQTGQKKFHLCSSCHQIGADARAGFGPPLTGVVGRKAGTVPDYAYSAAMKQSGIIWSEDKLKAFLRSPGDVVPGTKMRFWGISNEQELADITAYLASVK